MGRIPLFMVAVGKKGVGKSFKTNEMIGQSVSGYGGRVTPRKVLILDVNDEYANVKAIAIDDVERFSQHPTIEARRIRPFKPGTRREEYTMDEISDLLGRVLMSFRSGLFVVEDINKYVNDNMKQDLIGAICTNRHKDLDIITHYQSIGRITPKVWQNVNWVRFHKNNDSVARHKIKIEDKTEIFHIVENIVNKQYDSGNIRYNLYVDVDEMKIVGETNKTIIDAALDEYVNENYNSVVRVVKYKNRSKKLSDLEAARLAVDDMRRRYFRL